MKKIQIYFFILIIFVLTFPQVGESINVGVDNSYYFAYNYFFVHGLSKYYAIFSYGPLGFLFFPQPVGNNLALGLIFWGVLYLIFLIQLFVFSSHNNKPLILNIVLIYFISNFVDLWYIPIFSLCLSFLFYLHTKNYTWLIYCSLLFGVISLVKVTYFMTGIAVYGGFAAVQFTSWVDEKFKLKQNKVARLKILSLVFSGYFFFLFTFWSILTCHPSGLIDFLRGYWEIAKGDSGIMAIYAQNNWLMLGLFLFIFVLIYKELKTNLETEIIVNSLRYFYIFFLPILFLMWKYTFVRQDPAHLRFFFDFLVIFYGLILIKFAVNYSILGLMIFSLLVFGFNMQQLPVNGNPNFLRDTMRKIIKPVKVANFKKNVINYARYNNILQERSQKYLEINRLNKKILLQIGMTTVDVYPWEASIIAANSLSWSYRPVFQSYVSFTPWLDLKNSRFLKSNQAPVYLLWQKSNTEDLFRKGEEESIDGRYLLNDEPETIRTILSQYERINEDERVVLFKKIIPAKKILKTSDMKTIVWGEWVQVPNVEEGTKLQASVEVSRNLIQEIKKIIWKEGKVSVEYRYANGSTRQYRIGVDNMKLGVWVLPWYSGIPSISPIENVTYVRFLKKQSDMYDNQLKLRWLLY